LDEFIRVVAQQRVEVYNRLTNAIEGASQ